jgi:hypothetical protein
MQIKCTQCGGEVEVLEGESFLTCGYCNSSLYVDKKKIVYHYVLQCTFDEEAAVRNLRRWMAGNYTVKHLDRDARVTGREFFYFPLWYFKGDVKGHEQVYLQPAASTSVSEIRRFSIPAGDLKFFQPGEYEVSEFKQPDVLYDSALSWLRSQGAPPEAMEETALVHIPLYSFAYRYKDREYKAVVDGATGQVFANLFPSKSEAPYLAVAILVASAFLLEGIFCRFSGLGVTSQLVIYGITAIPAFAICYATARKV